MALNNKEKNTRKVTFHKDYYSAPSLDAKGSPKPNAEPIYRKGSVHAIHHTLVKKLQSKMSEDDMTVETFDFPKMKETAAKEFRKNKAKERAYA